MKLQVEISVVPGRRPGDVKGSPVPVGKQVITQVDWSFQSDRSPWKWSIQDPNVILPVDRNVGECLVKGSTCAPLLTSVPFRDLLQEPAKK